MPDSRFSRRRLRVPLAATPALVFLLFGGLLLAALSSQDETRAAVAHTRDVQVALRDVLFDLEDAQTGQRGYLLSGESQYLAPYRAGVARIVNDTGALRRLTRDNPVQQRNLDTLAPLISATLTELRQTVALRSAKGLASVLPAVHSNRGKQFMDAIRANVAAMSAEEARLLADRAAAEAERRRATLALLLFGGMASIALALLVNHILVRDARRLEQQAATITSQNARLEADGVELLAQLEESQSLQEELETSNEELETTNEEIQSANEQMEAAMSVAEEVAHDEQLLASASAALASAPFDVESSMNAVVRATTPSLADYCSIDILAEDGTIRRVAAAHHDQRMEQVLTAMWAKYPFQAAESEGSPAVLRTGQPVLVPEMTDAQFQRFARSEEHLAMLRQLGPRSYLAVPLHVAGKGAGVFALVMSDSGRRMDDRYLRLANEVARRTGLAIERAQLYAAARRAQEEAKEANEAKSHFLAAMSHELRTPLNAIMGYTDLIELGVSGPVTEQQHQHLERVRAASHTLLQLVDDVLDLAKIEAGTLRVEEGRGVAADCVNAALALVRTQAAAKSVAISDDCEGDGARAYRGDQHRATQIITNLLVNAVKFTDRGGRVTATCVIGSPAELPPTLGGDQMFLAFHVTDTGIGIRAEDQDRLFAPFVQVTTGAGVTSQTGTGLGLAISRQLARLMDGDLTVKSAPGRGSTFTLWMPLADGLQA